MRWLCGEQELDIEKDPSVRVRTLPSGDIEVQWGDRVAVVAVAKDARGTVYLGYRGQSWSFQPARGSRGSRGAALPRSGSLVAPMTGIVSAVHVAVGQVVEAYQALAVVEAMKVMATLEAPFAGTVTAIHVASGDRVEHGMVLVELEKT